MADKNPPANDQQQDPPAEETPAEEKAFWDKLDEKIQTGVGAAIESKLKEFRESSNSRTGRSTLPGFVADFMFGKATDKK